MAITGSSLKPMYQGDVLVTMLLINRLMLLPLKRFAPDWNCSFSIFSTAAFLLLIATPGLPGQKNHEMSDMPGMDMSRQGRHAQHGA